MDCGDCGLRQPHLDGTLFTAASLPRLTDLALTADANTLCERIDLGVLRYAAAGLSSLHLDVRGSRGLAGLASLGRLVRLERLVLTATGVVLGNSGVLPLADALPRLLRLSTLRLVLAGTGIDAAGLERLARGVAACPSLAILVLDVSQNALTRPAGRGQPLERLVTALICRLPSKKMDRPPLLPPPSLSFEWQPVHRGRRCTQPHRPPPRPGANWAGRRRRRHTRQPRHTARFTGAGPRPQPQRRCRGSRDTGVAALATLRTGCRPKDNTDDANRQ